MYLCLNFRIICELNKVVHYGTILVSDAKAFTFMYLADAFIQRDWYSI